MIDWTLLSIEVIKGIIIGTVSGIFGFVAGMYIFNKYFLPRLVADMGSKTIKAASEDPEIKPFIDKAKAIIDYLEPFVKQLKNVDLNKLQNDLKPLLRTIKKIDPETIEELVNTLKDLAGTVKEKLEQPKKIPNPD